MMTVRNSFFQCSYLTLKTASPLLRLFHKQHSILIPSSSCIELIASQEPPNILQLIKQRIVNKDSGAGVFGALNHITLGSNNNNNNNSVF